MWSLGCVLFMHYISSYLFKIWGDGEHLGVNWTAVWLPTECWDLHQRVLQKEPVLWQRLIVAEITSRVPPGLWSQASAPPNGCELPERPHGVHTRHGGAHPDPRALMGFLMCLLDTGPQMRLNPGQPFVSMVRPCFDSFKKISNFMLEESEDKLTVETLNVNICDGAEVGPMRELQLRKNQVQTLMIHLMVHLKNRLQTKRGGADKKESICSSAGSNRNF